jgi:tuftelin-interacting protein 11
MGRRKRATIEDDMDSSDDSAQEGYDDQEELDADERAERELFENPYQQRKRRRLNGKDDATYGIFAEEEDGEPRYARAGPKKRAKYIRST